jgi:signal transduction histidine kinase/ligand-binding sensor domain-containing protein
VTSQLLRRPEAGWLALLVLAMVLTPQARALDPHKSLSQYSRTSWDQADGLPQDTVRAITQTSNGYLWLGTDEGLARFDGYEFTTFDKAHGQLPANSIAALAAAADGSLWIGTPNGLVEYRNQRFRTYTTRDGLPDNSITSLYVDHEGALWLVAGESLSRFADGRFTNYQPGPQFPVSFARNVVEDRNHVLWVAGFSAVGKLENGRFTTVIGEADLAGQLVTSLAVDQENNLWIGGSTGILVRSPSGRIRRYDTGDGLPTLFVRALWCDRNGTMWVGTNRGVARFDHTRFSTAQSEDGEDQVRCVIGDREGNLWVGEQNTGLMRFRDDLFTVLGRSEGLPSDQPNAVFQDREGRIWVAFHDAGVMLFEGDGTRIFTTRDGLPNNEVYSIHERRNGDLLIAARDGMAVFHGEEIIRFTPSDPLARLNVFTAIEDTKGRIWAATPGGLNELQGDRFVNVTAAGPISAATVTLLEARDGTLWAGTFGKGLWSIHGGQRRLYTSADGLSADAIRALYEDNDGTIWIGTLGGGLDSFRDGHFQHFTQKDGLLSDNIGQIIDDGQSLWLGTTRGICRIGKKQLRDFAGGAIKQLTPENYGIDDGLRSAQCGAAFPAGGGGVRLTDGRIWFTTSRGLAIYDPHSRPQAKQPPLVHVYEVVAGGKPVDLSRPARLAPDAGRVQFRYTAIHLSDPERIQYYYKLDGLDADWVRAGRRRVINYNSLSHGPYRFHVRAEIPGGLSAEDSYSFVLLPFFYETVWFRLLAAALLCAAAWAIYQMRLRQIRSRFALVLEERARLAREIHDTLAQGFVGISSQLDAVALSMPPGESAARKYLEMAQKMARHSLTEARRSVMDLRASMLEDQDLAAALRSGTLVWTAGQPVEVAVDVTGDSRPLPQNMEQHLLRIAQEAVTNTLKHGNATKIWIKLHMEAKKLYLRIMDDGRGFEQQDVFSSLGGHFGLLGMRERAERLGGELRLASQPGNGTQVEVEVPLP